MLSGFVNTLLNIFGSLGYFSILFLMIVESSFLPFPSELVMLPAGYLAHQGELNLIIVILLGTIGSIIGALINYYLSKYLGRPIIYSLAKTKLAKLFFINSEKIEKSELLFNKYGKISTFLGRLIPGIRQLISIPAGLAEMPIKSFIIYTFGGALIWNIFLVILGWEFGANQTQITKYLDGSKIIGIILFIILIIYIFSKIKKIKIKHK